MTDKVLGTIIAILALWATLGVINNSIELTRSTTLYQMGVCMNQEKPIIEVCQRSIDQNYSENQNIYNPK